jgi:hypothetical protein
MRCWRRSTVTETYAPTRRANRVADWIETLALQRGTAVGAHQLQEVGETHGYSAVDLALGITTVRRRRTLVGHGYPFRTAGGGVAASDRAATAPWTALLVMSSESPLRAELDTGQAGLQLERITAVALRSLYGPGTQSRRFGWPSDIGRPREFPEAVRWLAKEMGVPAGSAYRPPHRKDGGVDVVAWRPFPDGRSGFPVLLCQCTLEKDSSHKAADVDVRVWSGWLALDTDPATALALSEVVAAGEEWNTLAARTIVLDRIRLAALIDNPQDPELGSVQRWMADALRDLRSQP